MCLTVGRTVQDLDNQVLREGLQRQVTDEQDAGITQEEAASN